MRKTVFAAIAMILSTCVAQAAAVSPQMSYPLGQDIILAQSVVTQDGQNFYSGNNRQRQQRARFVCVITPPDSANRNRPYVCPVQQGRVGGRCRCSGVVGNGNIDTAW
ncbi:hypothetical protein [Rhizobium sp. RM]|uniref:hypothetical protein n=1 Tax=Rhizobium sp. RM TaxID=2748079 RepID=UPI00110F4DE4|nr:hypothetical protein [Rhizobium sp. RM]NWJ25032.1 hypothetical protein [Rhizobium sp. RM]TMV16806.1 hypothetical protein BJG94_20580 [Rhizobium sp. Td3]